MNPETIEALIAKGRDNYEARLAAGQARKATGDLDRAIDHLTAATAHRPDRTTAWQALGACYNERRQAGDPEQARLAWNQGLAAAKANGDKQAEKVMAVWLRRLDRNAKAE